VSFGSAYSKRGLRSFTGVSAQSVGEAGVPRAHLPSLEEWSSEHGWQAHVTERICRWQQMAGQHAKLQATGEQFPG